MALQANVTMNYSSYTAGQNPPPMATVTVFNPNASAVVVQSINMTAHPLLNANVNNLAMSPSVPPTGPGMTTSVPALGSITIGPFPIVVASAANVNSFQMVNQTGNIFPVNPQGSQPPQTVVMVGAQVFGSDGSVNTAGEASVLVSYAINPPLGTQGGFMQFADGDNLALGLVSGVL